MYGACPMLVTVEEGRATKGTSGSSFDMIRQGVVVAPLGYWRKLNPAGGSVNAAISATFTDLGHTAAGGDALVEVVAS